MFLSRNPIAIFDSLWNHIDMNALQYYRHINRLKYADISRMTGITRSSVWKHCHAEKIPHGACAVYALKLGIDLKILMLGFCPTTPSTPTEPEEVDRAG